MYTENTIGKTVWSQISINTKMACGMREPIAIENGLLVTVLSRCKKIRITLNSMDTYDIDFIQVISNKPKTIESKKDIYCDQLSEILYKICNK